MGIYNSKVTQYPNISTSKSLNDNSILKNNLIDKYGTCYKSNNNSDSFFAHSYKEDCWLIAENRYKFDERIEWNNEGKFIVAYLKENYVIKLFT